MDRAELIEALRDEQRVDGKEQVVVIRTDKQLLPNAEYIFDFDVAGDWKIVLRPTMLHVES